MKTAFAWFVAMIVAAIFIIWGLFFGNPVANASNGSTRVEVFWLGTPCIDVMHITGLRQTICGGYEVFYNNESYPGITTGVDPIMGNASSILCKVYVNGEFQFSDFASNGDGTDVNCFVDIYSKNGMYV